MTPMLDKWILPDYGTLKINTNVAFIEGKTSIGIIVRNHPGIPLLTKAIPRLGCYSVDYGEILGIIERYSVGLLYT